jgi:hypothetical protein
MTNLNQLTTIRNFRKNKIPIRKNLLAKVKSALPRMERLWKMFLIIKVTTI